MGTTGDLSFFTWEMLSTYAGALFMVLILTELTKTLPYIENIPTQLWSYMTALCVLFPATFFTGDLSAENAVLLFFNAAVIALASNGGYELLTKFLPKS